MLPETFPAVFHSTIKEFVLFVKIFQEPEYPGLEKLSSDLQDQLTPNGKVLVCLSGGRDSCYILHLIHEFGFDVIVYTYDWGMVTTAARENMSRMCGDLGIEHVLVSPDIRQNRVRIHRVLRAWLKSLKLGTIPILMAGDKPYFRWAREIARERGDIPAVLADHPMETTGFKAMLAGATFLQIKPVEFRIVLAQLVWQKWLFPTACTPHNLRECFLPFLKKDSQDSLTIT